MKTRLWLFALAAVLMTPFATDLWACGERPPPNGCARDFGYLWNITPPSDGTTEYACTEMQEKHPMWALFDGDEKTSWMTRPEYYAPEKIINWNIWSKTGELSFEGVRVLGSCS